MRFSSAILLLSTSLLVACGGGGGGGHGGVGGGYVRPSVPYYAPTRVDNFQPLTGSGTQVAVTDIFKQDLNNDSVDEVVIGGRMTQPATTSNWRNFQMQIYGWNNNNTFGNETTRWFQGNDNIILGSEPSIKFGDFNGDGKPDMFVASSTDMNYTGPGYVYLNSGSQFTRQTLNFNNVWSHDSAVADFNRDGLADFMVADNSGKLSIAFGTRSGTPVIATSTITATSGSGLAVGDFLGNGSTSIILTDTATGNAGRDVVLRTMTVSGTDLWFTDVATLPASRFTLPKWSGVVDGARSHEIRAMPMDFDRDGKLDVIVISTPGETDKHGKFSEIQFVRNLGNGQFLDVTDTVLVGYNTSTMVSYNPTLIDINNDGLMDILLSGVNPSNTSTRILLQTREGKFVDSYSSVFKDFLSQTTGSTSNSQWATALNIVQGPNNALYLVNSVPYNEGGTGKQAVYLAKIGTTGTITAEATATAVSQTWPYLSSSSVNEVLAKTAQTNFAGYSSSIHGNGVVDPNAALNPIGALGLPLQGRLGPLTPLRGFIAGVKLDVASARISVVDEMRRDFTINIQSTSVSTLNAWGRNTEFVDQHQLTSHAEYLVNSGTMIAPAGFRIGQDPKNYTIGSPEVWINNKWSVNAQYTNLEFNPWIQLGGIWGAVTGSSITELVSTYRQDYFVGQAGILHASTRLTPGLVTRISDIAGAWAEGGLQFRDEKGYGLGLYAGIKPVMFTGGADVRMPSAVDANGNIVYTNKHLDIQNPMTAYMRAIYTGRINKVLSFIVGGTILDNLQFRTQASLQFKF